MSISNRQKINNEIEINKRYAKEALFEMDMLLDELSSILNDGGTQEEIDYCIKELIVVREILYDVKYFR